jgi:hypothetical protein
VAVTKFKRQGNCHELAVALKLTELGGIVSWPYGDGQSYDLIVDFDGKVSRVQVKGTAKMNKSGGCTVNLHKGCRGSEVYTKDDIDVMIACTPLGTFVIPIKAMKLTALSVWTIGTRKKQPSYEPFREAWHLLR